MCALVVDGGAIPVSKQLLNRLILPQRLERHEQPRRVGLAVAEHLEMATIRRVADFRYVRQFLRRHAYVVCGEGLEKARHAGEDVRKDQLAVRLDFRIAEGCTGEAQALDGSDHTVGSGRRGIIHTLRIVDFPEPPVPRSSTWTRRERVGGAGIMNEHRPSPIWTSFPAALATSSSAWQSSKESLATYWWSQRR
jgi:hypothetical protein